MILFLFFVVGLIIGSFLNVVVCRLKEGETLFGRSVCRSCRHQIRWYDNVPLLSYVLLRGQCRDCRLPIALQYPLMEFLTGVGFLSVGLVFFESADPGTWMRTGWLLGMISLLLVIAMYDLRYMEIPVVLLFTGALWMVAYLALLSYQYGSLSSYWWQHPGVQGLLGGGVVTLFFFMLVYVSHETWMGWGDVWLGGIVGMAVGFGSVLFLLTLSFGIGACSGLVMMARGKKSLESQVPFAPYLVLGTILTLLLPPLFPEWTHFFLL